MKNIAVILALIFVSSGASAQTRTTFKDIDRDLKQTESTATVMALIDSIATTEPQTEEDVAVLGQLMDKYPAQGQKAAMRIKDPKLAKAVMKECDRKVAALKGFRGQDLSKLPRWQQEDVLNTALNAQLLVARLGSLKNPEALPYLKQYVVPEYDGELSYAASRAIGELAPEDPVVFSELWNKSKEMRNIDYHGYRKSALRKVAEQLEDKSLSPGEKTRILGRSGIELRPGSDAEDKKLLKDLVKNHPFSEMRESAGQALMHTMREKFEPEDKTYLKQWLANKDEGSVAWALYVVRDHWDNAYTPELINIMRGSKWNPGRSRAAEILAQNKKAEAIPYLETCMMRDNDETTRGICRYSYYLITGKVPSLFTAEDAKSLEINLFDSRAVEFYNRLSENDADKKFYRAKIEALLEYKKTHR